MGESVTHMRLVQILAEWIASNFLDGERGLLMVDDQNATSSTKPPTIFSFVPDVLVQHTFQGKFIIGEAKTAKDLETRHSYAQYQAFIRKCGEYEDSVFVLAVPWHVERLAKSIVQSIKLETRLSHVNTVVLEKLPG